MRSRRRVGDGISQAPTYPAFDRVFISVVILIGIHLLWLRFMEPQTALEIANRVRPIELETLLSILTGFFVVRYG